MQTCSQCLKQCSDSYSACPHCHANLMEFSITALTKNKLINNSRVSNIKIIAAEDACPACRQQEGNYSKVDLPDLPIRGCSHENGCNCFYEPVLEEIFP